MGFVSDLFGGVDNSDQKKQNKNSQAYIEQQAAQARNDVTGLVQDSRYPLQMGYQGATDAKTAALLEAMKAYTGGSQDAQQLLVKSMPQIQNAILGKPVDSSYLQVSTPDTSGMDWLADVVVGERTGLHKGEALPDISDPSKAGLAGELSGIKSGETNQVAVEKLYQNGLITEKEYRIMQETFAADPSVANDTTWTTAGSADQLLNRKWSGVTPEYKQVLSNVFSKIYS